MTHDLGVHACAACRRNNSTKWSPGMRVVTALHTCMETLASFGSITGIPKQDTSTNWQVSLFNEQPTDLCRVYALYPNWTEMFFLGMGEYALLSNIQSNFSLFVICFVPNAGIRYFQIIRCSRIGSQRPSFFVKPSEMSSQACRKTPPTWTFLSSVPSCFLA